MMGIAINMDLISSNADLHDSSKSHFASFSNNLHNGLKIFEKSLINLLLNPACPKKLLIYLTVVGGKRVFMIETFAWSTSNSIAGFLCPKTIPSITMKWNFSQFKAKFLSWHL